MHRRCVLLGTVLCLLASACGGAEEAAVADDAPAGAPADATEAAEGCEPVTIRLSFADAEGSITDQASDQLIEAAAEATDGRVTIESYPGLQLANSDQQAELESVQSGVIEAAWISPALIGAILEPRLQVWVLPFLIDSHDVADALEDGAMRATSDEWIRGVGLEPLAWGRIGFRQVTTSDRPIRTPADLEGLRFRVAPSPIYQRTFELMGGDAQQISFGELFTALQQGVVDGQENPLAVIEANNLAEVQGHVSIWNYSYSPLTLVVNPGVHDGLCAADQEALRTAAEDAGRAMRDLVRESDETLPGQLAEQGMEVLAPEDLDLEAFRAAVEPIYAELTPQIGEDAVQQMRAAIAEAGR